MNSSINFEMYPFVPKEDLTKYKRLYEEQKDRNDDLHNKLDLFNYALNEGKIKDTKLNEVMRQNILFEIKHKAQEKKMNELSSEISDFKERITQMEQEKAYEEERSKKAVHRLIHVEESTIQKVKLLEEIDYKLGKSQKELEQIQKLRVQIITEIKGVLPQEEIKLLPSLQARENRKINKALKQITKRMNAPFFKEKNRERARQLLFDVRQSVSLLDDSQKEIYEKEIERIENVI